MKITIKFARDFYSPLHKKTFSAGTTLEIDVDEENFPTHSFWQEQFRFNELSGNIIEILALDTKNKPKK